MWRPGGERVSEVTCIACGQTVARADAREYDRFGDRWERREKDFEFLCKPCHRDLCHQPRAGLEDALADAGAGQSPRAAFLARFAAIAEGRDADDLEDVEDGRDVDDVSTPDEVDGADEADGPDDV